MYRSCLKGLVIVVMGMAGLVGCTNEQVYDSVQTNQRNECEKLQLSQRDDCLKRLGPNYDTYEHQRDELNKK